jgi:ribosomal protein S18 acetylase RimI-like enzyme
MGVMDVRPARLEDAAEIGAIHVRSWQAAYRGLLPQAYLDGLDPAERTGRWERNLSATDWSRSGTLVADADEELLGFVSYGPARDDDTDASRDGEVYAIYLRPGAWGQRTGQQLMTAALEGLGEAGYGQAILWVLEDNARARRFYEAGGWLADGAVKHDDSLGFVMSEVRYRTGLA